MSTGPMMHAGAPIPALAIGFGDSDLLVPIDEEGTWTVAWVDGTPIGEETERRVRLFAAAPEMAALLQQAEQLGAAAYEGEPEPEHYELAKGWLSDMRALLARIRGLARPQRRQLT